MISCVLFQQGFFIFVFHTCRKTEIREKFNEARQHLFSTHGRTSSVVPPPAVELNALDGAEGNQNGQRGSAKKSVDAWPSSRVKKVTPLNARKAWFSPPKGQRSRYQGLVPKSPISLPECLNCNAETRRTVVYSCRLLDQNSRWKISVSWISIYNTSEWCFSRDLIGSSISDYQVLFNSTSANNIVNQPQPRSRIPPKKRSLGTKLDFLIGLWGTGPCPSCTPWNTLSCRAVTLISSQRLRTEGRRLFKYSSQSSSLRLFNVKTGQELQ